MGKKIKLGLVILSIIFMLYCFFATPFEGLEPKGMRFLGIFVFWLMMMVADLIPNYLSCFIALALSVAVRSATLAEAFKDFGGSTCILLIGAFGMAAGLTNSGLLSRLALYVMRLFPGTYKGQLWAVSIAALAIGPTIPSTTAKGGIIIPVVNSIVDAMGYEPRSKGAIGLISCANVVNNCCGPMFMTGGIVAALMLAMYPGTIGWGNYLVFALIWGLIVFFGTVFFHMFAFNPDKGKKKDEIIPLDKAVLQQRLEAMGPLSKNKQEIVALIVLVSAIVLWITEKQHGIPTAIVAVAGWCVLYIFKLFKPEEFVTKMMWPIWALVATILGLVGLLSSSGVAAWISNLVGPVVSIFAGSPFLVVVGCSLLSTALMMGLVNYLLTAAICLALLSSAPMDMLCVLFAVCMSGMIFILPPQNVPMLAAEGLAGGRFQFTDSCKQAGLAYFVCNLVGLIVSVPWWKILGFIY